MARVAIGAGLHGGAIVIQDGLAGVWIGLEPADPRVLTVDEDGQYTIDRIVCVVDCGFAVNPLGIESQIQGGIMLGLNAAAYGAIDMEKGVVVQSNFHDYRALRVNQMPDVEVHILDSEEAPTGVGEQATTAAAPALANALFHATGRRVRQFPLDRHGFILRA